MRHRAGLAVRRREGLRWWVGAGLALASGLTAAYWEAVVPRPGAAARVVAVVPADRPADLGPVQARVRSVHVLVDHADPFAVVVAGAVQVEVVLELTAAPGATAGGAQPFPCAIRLTAGERVWLATGASASGASAGCAPATGRLVGTVQLPPDVAAGELAVELARVDQDPRLVRFTGWRVRPA